MESIRVETDASVSDTTVVGYIIYQMNDNGSYSEVDRGVRELEVAHDSHRAEELAIIQGLSVAREHYSSGAVTVLTDHQSTVKKVEKQHKLSDDKGLNRGLSNIMQEFDEVLIKWQPSQQNVAHEVCRTARN